MIQNCNCGMCETLARLTMDARSGKSPTENDQLGASLRCPTRCQGLFGLLLPLLLFIEPQPLEFVGEEVVLCVCAVPPPPSPCCFFFFVFLPGEGRRVSSHYRLCVGGDRGAVCLHSSFESHPATPPPAPVCLLRRGLCAAQRRHWLVSLLSGASARPCISVCLLVCFRLPTCPSISRCHLAAAAWGGPHGVCPVARAFSVMLV